MTKKVMIAFLSEHFRYSTMNSWNNATSYAHNLKIHKVIPSQYQDIAYELIEQGDIYDDINHLIGEFEREYQYIYQAGFNGRSGGYLVLYRGGRKQSEYKSYCTECGQRNYKTIAETDSDECGKCGQHTRVDFSSPKYEKFTYPGKDIDQDADFEAWTIDELRERVSLVKRFDKLAKDIINLTIDYAKGYHVEEETISVPKVIKVLKKN